MILLLLRYAVEIMQVDPTSFGDWQLPGWSAATIQLHGLIPFRDLPCRQSVTIQAGSQPLENKGIAK